MNEFRELLKKKNKKIEEVNKNTACIKIQALWRGYRAREQILDLEDAVIIIQAYWKGQLERRKFKQLVINNTKVSSISATDARILLDTTNDLDDVYDYKPNGIQNIPSGKYYNNIIGFIVYLAILNENKSNENESIEWVKGIVIQYDKDKDDIVIFLVDSDENKDDDVEIVSRTDEDVVYMKKLSQ